MVYTECKYHFPFYIFDRVLSLARLSMFKTQMRHRYISIITRRLKVMIIYTRRFAENVFSSSRGMIIHQSRTIFTCIRIKRLAGRRR